MKKLLITIFITVFLTGCACAPSAQIAATTLPVYEFTAQICQGTPLRVTRLVTEEVSCLHDYSLNVRQVKAAEAAQVIVISGAGLEVFLEDMLTDTDQIDASAGITLLSSDAEHSHDHEEADDVHEHEHHHENDPHIWLSPENAKIMAQNICNGLSLRYPEYQDTFEANLVPLLAELDTLQAYGEETLASISCRELITFHDGFAYFAHAYDLEIIRSMEEESGQEASAKELIELVEEVKHHQLPSIFTEKGGSVSAAGILSRETGCGIYSLDMAMAGDSYFEAMYHNIDTVKEALS